ncbi:MAG TPA: hypothetical protein VMV45_04955, partial [Casimicrobiaceae bacterium]|nr:hypothetical protein [Casimicrobiaceae bacterium]
VEIPDEIKNKLDIHPVRWIEQVLEQALECVPKVIEDEAKIENAETAKVPAATPAEDGTAVIKH